MNIKDLLDNPTEYDFFQAVYTIERQLAAGKEQQQKVGHDSIPKQANWPSGCERLPNLV